MTRIPLLLPRKPPGERLMTHVSPEITTAIDAWIASQPGPKPSRADAIRTGLNDWLTGLGLLKHRDDPEGANGHGG